MDIEIYEEMALYQTKIAIRSLLKNLKFMIISLCIDMETLNPVKLLSLLS